jgi:hypothetical protein
MSLKQVVSSCFRSLRIAFVAVTVFQFSLGGPLDEDNPYVPLNSPALGDLFDFGRHGGDHQGDEDHGDSR